MAVILGGNIATEDGKNLKPFPNVRFMKKF